MSSAIRGVGSDLVLLGDVDRLGVLALGRFCELSRRVDRRRSKKLSGVVIGGTLRVWTEMACAPGVPVGFEGLLDSGLCCCWEFWLPV